LVDDHRVAREAKRLQGSLRGFRMSGAASVRDDDRHETEIRRMPRRGFDADLKRDPDEGDRRDAAVPQYNRERRAFKRRHRNLVEYSLRRSRLKLRHEGETRT